MAAVSRGCTLGMRARGFALAIYGTMCVCPDAVLLRLAEREGGTVWVSIACKMLATAFFSALWPLCQHGIRSQIASIRGAPYHFWATALLQGLINFFYCVAFLETGVAKALMLISLHPIWAGIGGWRFLGDELPVRTLFALGGAVAAMVLMFVPPAVLQTGSQGGDSNVTAGSGQSAAGDSGQTRNTLHGDLVALAAGLCVACNIILSRHASQHRPEAPLFLAIGVGVFTLALASAVVACVQSDGVCADFGVPNGKFVLIVVASGFLLANCLMTLLVLAPKYISSAEVALVLLLETILSPVWTFVGVGETPTPWTIAGGGLLIAVLALHELATVFATNSVETTTEGKQAAAVTSLAASCDLPEATPSATPSVGLV